MKRLLAAAVAVSIAIGCLLIGNRASEASPFTLNFTGHLVDGTSRQVTGSITVDQFGPLSSLPSGSMNDYQMLDASFHVEIDHSISFSNPSITSGAGLIFLKDPGGGGIPPYDSMIFDISPLDATVTRLTWRMTSLNTDPSIPILTLQTLPKSLAAWVATYGPIAGGALSHVSSSGGSGYDFQVTGYTIVATTPIPAALLLFGTALTGLGGVGFARRMGLLKQLGQV